MAQITRKSRVVQYLRNSTERNAVSVEQQEHLLEKVIKDNDLELVDSYIDRNTSGTDLDRKEYNRLYDDLSEGHHENIDYILCMNNSRRSRQDIFELGGDLQFFRYSGIKWVFYDGASIKVEDLSDRDTWNLIVNQQQIDNSSW